MELIERTYLTAVKYLNSMKYDTFKNDHLNDAEMSGEKNLVLKILKRRSMFSRTYVKQT